VYKNKNFSVIIFALYRLPYSAVLCNVLFIVLGLSAVTFQCLICFHWRDSPKRGLQPPHCWGFCITHLDTHTRMISSSLDPLNKHKRRKSIPSSGFEIGDPCKRAAADLRLGSFLPTGSAVFRLTLSCQLFVLGCTSVIRFNLNLCPQCQCAPFVPILPPTEYLRHRSLF